MSILHTTTEAIKTLGLGEPAIPKLSSSESKDIAAPDTDIKIGTHNLAEPFAVCPYCGKELKLPKTPHFCPYYQEKLVADG